MGIRLLVSAKCAGHQLLILIIANLVADLIIAGLNGMLSGLRHWSATPFDWAHIDLTDVFLVVRLILNEIC